MDVAGEIVDALRRRAHRVRADRHRLNPSNPVSGPCRIGRRGAPGIGAPLAAARGIFPLGLGRQSFAMRQAIVARAVPGHLVGRMILEARIGAPLTPHLVDAGVAVVPVEQVLAAHVRGAAEPLQKAGELLVGDGITIDPERFHHHRMRRPLIGQAVVAAHGEGAAFDAHHARRLGRLRSGAGDAAQDQNKCEISKHETILPHPGARISSD